MAKGIEELVGYAILNREQGPSIDTLTAVDITTAGAVTYTAAQILGGQINRDPNGTGRTDTLPTAALLAAALRAMAQAYGRQMPSGPEFQFVVQNNADAAETITIAVGSGGTIAASVATTHIVTIAQNTSRRFSIKFTSVVPGSEAYVLRNRGSITT